MRTEIKQQAFVLHSRPFRETSLLVTFFTEERGKQNAIIRGVRSSSKLARAKQAWLQPFQRLTISWVEKKVASSDLVTIHLLEPSNTRFPLMGEANFCGLYLNELLYRMLYPAVISLDLFKHYQQALFDLSKSSNRQQQSWGLRVFEYQLLSDLGVGLDLLSDSHGNEIDENKSYLFNLEQGFVVEFNEDKIGISGQCLIKFANHDYSTDCLSALKKLFRFILSYYLGDKPIKTRLLFKEF